jgi:hypothetical protein
MSDDWLSGQPMDPLAASVEPLPAIAGFPFLHAGSGAVIVGPTGAGRSSLAEAAMYDAARAGIRCAYFGSEVTQGEFNSRAAILAKLRGDTVDDELRSHLANVRYLDLTATIAHAWKQPDEWADAMTRRYDVAVIDPTSAVASTLNLDFDKSNAEFVNFYDRLIQPLVGRGLAIFLLDNVGHDPDAKSRAKGASAKSDRADLTFSCSISTTPPGLIIKAGKVRSIRAAHQRGDEWLFAKDTHRIIARQKHERGTTTTFRPTGQMQRISEALEHDAGLSKRAIRTAVGGKADTVDLALELLTSEGYITTTKDGQAVRHTSAKPYREPTVSTVSQPCLTPCPDTPPNDRVSVSPPLRGGHGHGHGPTNNGNSPTVSTDADTELDRIETKFKAAT